MKEAASADFGSVIRPARADELTGLTAIELDAFRTLAEIRGGDQQPHALPLTELRQALDCDLLFVATDGHDNPVGFLAAAEMDGALYVKELDVGRDWQRKGIGRRLMMAAIEVASRRGLRGVTLTTDRHVPFNAPFYAKLGFREMTDDDALPDLQQVLQREIAHEMAADRRMAMVLRFSR